MSQNQNQGCFKQFADIANLLAIAALILTAWQMRESNFAQIESNVNQEVGYTMDMLFPCWEQWKELHSKSQSLNNFDAEFLSKAEIAQDRWNVTLSTLRIEEGKIPAETINQIASLMQNSDFEGIKNKINIILVNNIDKVMKDFKIRIEEKRNKIINRTF